VGALRGRAPAKLNLYLEVVRRRPDGFHELRTLFQTLHGEGPVGGGDDVEVERRGTDPFIECGTRGADLPGDEGNLAVRAARDWLAAARQPGGARIALDKRVPLGGGLGGGSSDAATILRLLQRTPGSLDAATLDAVARGLGADVPFFLTGGTATATGRGDVIRPLPPAPRVAVVLLLPPFGTETGRVFARVAERLRRAPAGGLERAVDALASGDPARIRDAHHNDLAEAAMRAYPEMLRCTSLAERLLGRAPAMSGSGSTLFDVPDPGEVDDVLARLRPWPGRVEVAFTAP
jgi:4-diphosphocytidyl-2-C-methyl-D-erythritol kinase